MKLNNFRSRDARISIIAIIAAVLIGIIVFSLISFFHGPKDVPVMAAGNSWYRGSTDKLEINEIVFVDSYKPSKNESESWDASASQDGSVMCYVNGNILTIAGNGSGSIMANKDSSFMFSGSDTTEYSDFFFLLHSIEGLDLLDTSNVTNMASMFAYCENLKSLDLLSFDTSKVTNMGSMFFNCSSLGSLLIEGFNTGACTDMSSMFYSCFSLPAIDVGSFDTSNVTDMSKMFFFDINLKELDLSSFNTSKVVTMESMFARCENLKMLDLRSFTVTKDTLTDDMLINMPALEEISFGKSFAAGDMSRVLDAPLSVNNEGGDNLWRSVTTGVEYAPSDIPVNTEDTYVTKATSDAIEETSETVPVETE